MSPVPIVIRACGMVTAVGLDATSSSAAIRCAVDNFRQTGFMDNGGEWIIGAGVPMAPAWRGHAKLVKLAGMAIEECLRAVPGVRPDTIPLLLCVAEKDRPGRHAGTDEELYTELTKEMGTGFHPDSATISRGRISAAIALRHARELIHSGQHRRVLIVGTDSLLSARTLGVLEERGRLLTSLNHNGFIPGEGSGAVLVEAPIPMGEREFCCLGIGIDYEGATVSSSEPLRAEGLTRAIKAALAEAECNAREIDYRIADITGEQYYFKEAALALARVFRNGREQLDVWHPTDCVGEIGAAIGPVILGVAEAAARKGYGVGEHILCHMGNDAGDRAALVLAWAAHSKSWGRR